MLFSFHCPKCDGVLEADGSLSGLKASCPQCGTPVAVPESRVAPGTTLAGFQLERLLGKGGMGEVYLARQLSVDREVAVKILPADFAKNEQAVKRFLQEGRLAARLDHQNIATIYEAGEDEGHYYLAMVYVEGESLDRRLTRDGALPEAEALAIARSLAGALAYAWDEFRLVHRDIKPANIMLDRRGRVFLMDLGLAKSAVQGEGLTIDGSVLGTPQYMSPEQARGQAELGMPSDVYSLGTTLYHLATGRPPFAGNSLLHVLDQQINSAPVSPRERNPKLSEGCESLLLRMMAKRPEERPPTWAAVVAEIDAVLAGGMAAEPLPPSSLLGATSIQPPMTAAPEAPPSAVAAARPKTQSRWLPLATLAAGIVFVALLGVYLWRERNGPRPAASAPPASPTVGRRSPAPESIAPPGGANALAPERGKPWTEPATGMEFVWIASLGMWVGKYEVMNAEYRRMAPKHVSAKCRGHSLEGDRQPVTNVSWEDACLYASWLNEAARKTGSLPDGWRYRLPTKGEFVACFQCGDGRKYPWGNTFPPVAGQAGNYSDLDSAWWDQIKGYRDGMPTAGDVDRSWCNPWGIFGIGGNVWEACAADDSASQTLDAYYGGAWDNCAPRHLDVAARFPKKPGDRGATLGFRLVLAPVRGSATPAMPADSVAGYQPWERIILPHTGGWGLRFDGKDDHVVIPSLLWDGSGPNTVEAVVWLASEEWGAISGGAKDGGGWLEAANGQWKLAVRPVPGRPPKERAMADRVGRKVAHLAAVDDGKVVRFFVNGNRIGAIANPPAPGTKPHPFVLGAWVDALGAPLDAFFGGTIDCFRVSRSARYAESFSLADALPLRSDAETVCLLDLEEGEGTVARDSSGHGHDGEIRGATWSPHWPCPIAEERLRELEEALRKANPQAGRLIVRAYGRPGGFGIALSGYRELKDIGALRGLPVVELDLNDTGVADLSPLQGMPLRYLSANQTPVADLSPLAGCPLVVLRASGTPVSDLSPLRGIPLRFLHLLGCSGVVDLSPLRGMPLAHVCLTETGVRDISVLRGMPLRSIGLGGVALAQADASFLSSCPSLEIVTHVPPVQVARLRDALRRAFISEAGRWDAESNAAWNQIVYERVLPDIRTEIWPPPPRAGDSSTLPSGSPLLALVLDGRAEEALVEWRQRSEELGARLGSGPRRLVGEQLAALGRIGEDVAASLRADVGRNLALQLADGAVTAEILGVAEGGIRVMQEIKDGAAAGKMGRTIPLAALAPAERLRRLAGDEPERELQRGVVAWQAGNAEAARRSFAKAGPPIGAALASALEAQTAQRREDGARKAFAALLGKVAGSAGAGRRDETIQAIRARCLAKPSRVAEVREALAGLAREWGDTEMGRTQDALVREALEFPWPKVDWRVPGVEMEFVWIEALGLWVGKYEVTNGEYRFKEPGHVSKPYKTFDLDGDRQPVVWVNFDDACDYAAWLTERERAAGRLSATMRYRLPARDECMAYAQCGDGREYPWGNSWPPPVGKAGNYSGTESPCEKKLPGYRDDHPVACDVERSWVNPWGLFGVGGNVWELSAKDVGPGQSFDSWRGACWDNHDQAHVLCACRGINRASTRNVYVGFRLVLDPGKP